MKTGTKAGVKASKAKVTEQELTNTESKLPHINQYSDFFKITDGIGTRLKEIEELGISQQLPPEENDAALKRYFEMILNDLRTKAIDKFYTNASISYRELNQTQDTTVTLQNIINGSGSISNGATAIKFTTFGEEHGNTSLKVVRRQNSEVVDSQNSSQVVAEMVGSFVTSMREQRKGFFFTSATINVAQAYLESICQGRLDQISKRWQEESKHLNTNAPRKAFDSLLVCQSFISQRRDLQKFLKKEETPIEFKTWLAAIDQEANIDNLHVACNLLSKISTLNNQASDLAAQLKRAEDVKSATNRVTNTAIARLVQQQNTINESRKNLKKQLQAILLSVSPETTVTADDIISNHDFSQRIKTLLNEKQSFASFCKTDQSRQVVLKHRLALKEVYEYLRKDTQSNTAIDLALGAFLANSSTENLRTLSLAGTLKIIQDEVENTNQEWMGTQETMIKVLLHVVKIDRVQIKNKDHLNYALKNPSLQEFESKFFTKEEFAREFLTTTTVNESGNTNTTPTFLTVDQFNILSEFEEILEEISEGRTRKRRKPLVMLDSGEGKTFVLGLIGKYQQKIDLLRASQLEALNETKEATAPGKEAYKPSEQLKNLSQNLGEIVHISLTNRSLLNSELFSDKNLTNKIYLIDEDFFIDDIDNKLRTLVDRGAYVMRFGASQSLTDLQSNEVRQTLKSILATKEFDKTELLAKAKESQKKTRLILERRGVAAQKIGAATCVVGAADDNWKFYWPELIWKDSASKYQTKRLVEYIIPDLDALDSSSPINAQTIDSLKQQLTAFATNANVGTAIINFVVPSIENGQTIQKDAYMAATLNQSNAKFRTRLFLRDSNEPLTIGKVGTFETQQEFTEFSRGLAAGNTKIAQIFAGNPSSSSQQTNPNFVIGGDYEALSVLDNTSAQEIILNKTSHQDLDLQKQIQSRNRQTDPTKIAPITYYLWGELASSVNNNAFTAKDFAENCAEATQKKDFEDLRKKFESKLLADIYGYCNNYISDASDSRIPLREMVRCILQPSSEPATETKSGNNPRGQQPSYPNYEKLISGRYTFNYNWPNFEFSEIGDELKSEDQSFLMDLRNYLFFELISKNPFPELGTNLTHPLPQELVNLHERVFSLNKNIGSEVIKSFQQLQIKNASTQSRENLLWLPNALTLTNEELLKIKESRDAQHIQEEIEERERLGTQIEELQRENKRLGEENKKLKEENSRMWEQFQTLEEFTKILYERNKQKEEELNTTREEAEDSERLLEQFRETIETLGSSRNTLQLALNDKTNQAEQLQTQLVAATQRAAAANTERDRAAAERDGLQQQIKELTDAQEALQARERQLQEQLAAETRGELERLRKELTGKTSESEELQRQLANLQKQIEEREQELKTARDGAAQLAEMTLESEQRNVEMSEILTRQNQELEELRTGNESLQGKVDEMEIPWRQLNNESRDLQEQLKHTRQEVEGKDRELRDLRIEAEELMQHQETKEQSLQQRLAEAGGLEALLRQELDGVRRSATEERERLSEGMGILENIKNEALVSSERYRDAKLELERKLQETKQVYDEEAARLLTELEETNARGGEELKNLQQQLETSQREQEQLQIVGQELLQKKVQELEAAQQELITKNQELEHLASELQIKLRTEQESQERMLKLELEMQHLRTTSQEEKTQLETQQKEAEERANVVRAQAEQLQQELKNAQQELSNKAFESEELQQQLEALQKQRDEQEQAALTSARDASQQLDRKTASLRAENERLQRQVEELERRYRELAEVRGQAGQKWNVIGEETPKFFVGCKEDNSGHNDVSELFLHQRVPNLSETPDPKEVHDPVGMNIADPAFISTISTARNGGRGEKLRFLRGVYGGDVAAVKEMIKKIFVLAAEDSRLGVEQAIQFVALAKKESEKTGKDVGVSDIAKEKLDNEEQANQLKAFSKTFQRYAERCGIYSGRQDELKTDKLVGLRSRFVSKDILGELYKMNDEEVRDEEAVRAEKATFATDVVDKMGEVAEHLQTKLRTAQR